MTRAGCDANLKVPDQEGERHSQNHHQTQQVKAVHGRQHRRLLRHQARRDPIRLMNRIGTTRSARQ